MDSSKENKNIKDINSGRETCNSRVPATIRDANNGTDANDSTIISRFANSSMDVIDSRVFVEIRDKLAMLAKYRKKRVKIVIFYSSRFE